MTKRELIYTIYERLNIQNDDTDLTEEFVSSLIDSTRAKLIKQSYSANIWNIPIAIKQELCIDLSPVPSIKGETCFGKILASDVAIPIGIGLKGNDGSVLTIKLYDRKELRINMIPIERMPLVGSDPFTGGMIFGALDVDRKLYFTSKTKTHLMLDGIKVEGVYEKPSDAYELVCEKISVIVDPNSSSAREDRVSKGAAPVPEEEQETQYEDAWDVNYPLELAMQDDLINIIVKDLVTSYGIPSDESNDSMDKFQAPKK